MSTRLCSLVEYGELYLLQHTCGIECIKLKHIHTSHTCTYIKKSALEYIYNTKTVSC